MSGKNYGTPLHEFRTVITRITTHIPFNRGNIRIKNSQKVDNSKYYAAVK